jgi:hypothetical protein
MSFLQLQTNLIHKYVVVRKTTETSHLTEEESGMTQIVFVSTRVASTLTWGLMVRGQLYGLTFPTGDCGGPQRRKKKIPL